MNCEPTDAVMDKQPWGNAGDLETKKLEFKKKVEKSVWLCVPTKQLYQRQNIQSELLVKANAKRFEKYDTSYLDKVDKLQAVETRKVKETKGPKALDALFKVKIDQTDPNTFDMKLAYQDNLPPETKQLQEYVEGLKEREEENKESQIADMKQNAMRKLEYCQVKLLPTEDAKQSDITQMRFQQFKQREEEAKRAKEK